MENFDQIFTSLAEHEGIGLNKDILETGLINIIALIALLIIQFGKDANAFLDNRQKTISNDVQDAESRLKEAKQRLKDAEKQRRQLALTCGQIKAEAIEEQSELIEYYGFQAKEDQAARIERAFATYVSSQRETFLELKEKSIQRLVRRLAIRAYTICRSKVYSTSYTNRMINTSLKGDLS